ncbi:MAG: PEP-CTERM sorting domain-containing protein [Gemmatimonadales bacterium]
MMNCTRLRIREAAPARARNALVTAALVVAATLAAAGPARAQYTLTFDPSTAGTAIPGTYGSIAGVVDITSQTQTGFGSVSSISDGQCSGAHSSLCFVDTSPPEPAAQANGAQIYNAGNAAVGDFTFAPLGSNVAGFNSVVVGKTTNAAGNIDVRLYDAAGNWIADYTNSSLSGAVTITPTDFTLQGSHTFDDLANGFSFQWSTVGVTTGEQSLFIDNLTFKSELAPEPGTIGLFGMGLLGLAPLAIRRRRRKHNT